MSFEKFKKLGDNALDVYEKKFSKEGKDYIVKDGDIMHFKTKSFKWVYMCIYIIIIVNLESNNSLMILYFWTI